MSTPRLGQVVIYHAPPYPDGSPVDDCPAHVQSINEDGTVQLWVLGRYQVYMPLPALEGEGPFQWSQMPS